MQPDREPPTTRRLTVLNFRRPEGPVVPKIHLMGNWLENAGFRAGCRLRVTVEHQRLIIGVVEQPDPDFFRKKAAKALGLL
jgi:hypothetical protein